MRVVRIPRHRPCIRRDLGTTVLTGLAAQRAAVVARLRELREGGRPVLLATRTVATSEAFATLLDAAGLPYRLLNARHDAAEAGIVAEGGLPGRITIATNMAGRGTDIRLAGGVPSLGGLHVLVAECNGSRRLDRQLWGRAGRQADPGSHESILCREDPLLATELPTFAQRLASKRGARFPASGLRFGRALVRIAQWRAEWRAARQRRAALHEDRRIGESLAFSGVTE